MANMITQADGATGDTLYFPLVSKIIFDQISGNYQSAKRAFNHLKEFVQQREEHRMYHQIKDLEQLLGQQNPL